MSGIGSRVTGQSVSFGPKLRAARNDVLGGAAASVLTVTFGLSYSLLIFAGPLAPYLSYGVATTFISSAVLATVIALGSSLPFAIAGRTDGAGQQRGSAARARSHHARPFDHYHRHRALRFRGDADGSRDPLRALPGGWRISRRDRLSAPSRCDSGHHEK